MKEPRTVRVSNLLKKGSVFVAFICMMSLLIWFMDGTVMLGPMTAVLVLVSCPFFFWMGKLQEKEDNKE